jgi:hypothetical protein
VNARLDAISKAKQAYVLAKTTLEQRLREQIKSELANMQTQMDIAIRYAYDSGESKANILRALGTKDYNTLNESLKRTSGVTEVVGDDPLANVYSLMGEDMLVVTYDSHGPNKYSGEATFNIKRLDDGNILLLSLDSLWSEDYKTRNDVVAVLDGKTDGYYYDEAVEWLTSVTRSS